MNASDPGERSTRVEREIREILERTDSSQRPVDNFQAAVRRKRATVQAKTTKASSSRWTPAMISPALARILGALALAIAAAVVADYLRFLAVILAIASAVVFFSLWVPSRPSGMGGDATHWRGQRLDDDEPRFGFGASRTPPWRGPKRPQR
jgi:VIT1/CCC1 family predicted Fe2+/Mn2+ transporter